MNGPWWARHPERPHHRRAALDHRVGAGRAPAGLDPGLPDGRAHHRLLRPGAAAGVPRRPRRAWSTSSPSTWWWPPSSPWPRPGPIPTGPPCTTWPRACGTRCATASWSTWSSRGSPSTRSTTPTASRSWCPNGRSPDGVGCSASCGGPPPAFDHGRARPGRRCRSAASGPSWPARVEEQRTQAERALGYVELYGAYTETEAHFRVDRLLALWDAAVADRPGDVLLRPRRHRRGPTTSTTSICRRSSSTPGCGPRRHAPPWPAGRTGPAAPSCRPSVTWPPSTSRTR